MSTWRSEQGKSAEAREWYLQARELWGRLPGIRSVEAFVPQFGLASSASEIEIWSEIDDYAVLDKWDDAAAELGDEVIALARMAEGCVRQESARLVGDWLGSTIEDLKDDAAE